MLDIKKLLTKIIKCSYTSGTSNNWRYKKYADGTFIAYISTSKSFAVNTTGGSLYVSAEQEITLPRIGMTAIHYASVDFRGSEATWAKVNTATTSKLSYNLLSTISRTASTRYVFALIMGTWA